MRSIWHARDASCVCNPASSLPMAVGGWRVNQTKGRTGLHNERATGRSNPFGLALQNGGLCVEKGYAGRHGEAEPNCHAHVNGPLGRSLAIEALHQPAPLP